MFDRDSRSSRMASESLIEADTKHKVPHLTGCRVLLLAVLVALCSIVATVIVFQYASNPLFGVGGSFKRPPIAAIQRVPGGVAASGEVRAWPDPPPHDQVAKVARYVVHMSDWAAISTISVDDAVKGYPFGNILSVSDGPVDKSSGIPYMYLTPMDFTAKDLEKEPRASLTMTEATSDYCHNKSYDPEDPRCARVLMSGQVVKIDNGTAEWQFAQAALFSRHPAMADWPQGHAWFFAKLDISNIYMFDYFGGAAHIDVNDYYNVTWV